MLVESPKFSNEHGAKTKISSPIPSFVPGPPKSEISLHTDPAMFFLLPSAIPLNSDALVTIDKTHHVATVRDGTGNLRLKLSFAKGCVVKELIVDGRQVLSPTKGIWSGIKIGNRWFTSATLAQRPKLSKTADSLHISGITYQGDSLRVEEGWTLTAKSDCIQLKIDRHYLDAGTLQDSAMPQASFANMSTWTGALLGTGGVAWTKLLDAPNAKYALHTDSATLWNRNSDGCLRLTTIHPSPKQTALRFTRQPSGEFSMTATKTSHELAPLHGKARFLRDRQDIWAPSKITAGDHVTANFELKPLSYTQIYNRGDFKGLDTHAISEILNTIGRIGVIDDNIVGSNGWYSGYAVLHEPWLARVGSALNDPNYLRSMEGWLDFAKDHAISPDGMIKSRWCYTDGDAQPGTYDQASGFYEAQWGRLMDTQSSYVTDVADLFDQTGNQEWVRGQKQACEAALDYLLRRDSTGNGLVKMENSTFKQHRSSDWLDIVWASYENALVNAQLYGALKKWIKVESLLADYGQANRYYRVAEKLKASFNKPISEGGFWDPDKGWYVYWREADGSVHGNNLTVPVNLTALAEGLCDDPARRSRLLNTIEEKMKAESLLSWPACFEGYAPGEGKDDLFPTYENGDIFLAWAEYGVRAYAPTHPEIALKYVKQIVNKYKNDGLAFQRYLRKSGAGAGDDILANNCNVITGLYRDIFGIQPTYDRLVIDPHLVPELNGTRVNYDLRGKTLLIDLSVNNYRVQHDNFSVHSDRAFSVDFGPHDVTLFEVLPRFGIVTVQTNSILPVEVTLLESNQVMAWRISTAASSSQITLTFQGLSEGRVYHVVSGGKTIATVSSRKPSIKVQSKAGQPMDFELIFIP